MLLLIAYTTAISPAVTVSAPNTSARPPRAAGAAAGMYRTMRATKVTPIGTLTKKIHTHPGPVVSRPLAITPTEAALPPTAPKTPNALVRSGPSANVLTRIEGAAQSLAGTGDHELTQRSGKPCGERGDREQGEPGEQHPTPAEQVGGPPAEQQEATQHQAICDHHPLQIGLIQTEILLDRRQRDVHHRKIENDHELDPAHENENHPRVNPGPGGWRPGGLGNSCSSHLRIPSARKTAPSRLTERLAQHLPAGRSHAVTRLIGGLPIIGIRRLPLGTRRRLGEAP